MRASSLALAATIAWLVALPARADEPAGAFGASFLASPDESYGASLIGDLWVPIGPLRLGGTFGIGAMPSGGDEFNRIFMPLALSLALEFVGDVGVSVRARGGMWGGATQEEKLTAGALLGVGAHFLAPLGGGAHVTIGLDVWGVFGAGETVVFAPGVGLSWTPPNEAREAESDLEDPPLEDPRPEDPPFDDPLAEDPERTPALDAQPTAPTDAEREPGAVEPSATPADPRTLDQPSGEP